MDWSAIGGRIREQREFMGYTREQFAELIDVTPKFCSDMERGLKGMSVQTLCKISRTLMLSTDYILFGRMEQECYAPLLNLLTHYSDTEREYAEEILKTFAKAMNAKDTAKQV